MSISFQRPRRGTPREMFWHRCLLRQLWSFGSPFISLTIHLSQRMAASCLISIQVLFPLHSLCDSFNHNLECVGFVFSDPVRLSEQQPDLHVLQGVCDSWLPMFGRLDSDEVSLCRWIKTAGFIFCGCVGRLDKVADHVLCGLLLVGARGATWRHPTGDARGACNLQAGALHIHALQQSWHALPEQPEFFD